ncbi:arrestin domain-containing protein 3-like [Seriola lalandi dorsalis]|uniref:arrestin domain-containing protein 3-like n=1 Tax=Seriola lalandi dorsalis TaxID=1841481 RepID=UPI000C6FAECE|nr:arrestin domain-containing protein 3-like [Seriola lalandi dorsalis]
MEPQYGSKDKSVKLFGSGNVSMDVHTKRMGYKQGEVFQVIVEISNRSSRTVKPKFMLYEKRSFFAQGRRRVCTNEILKEKIEAVAPSSKETVTKAISIPRELAPSILNCSIIKLEYRLKVNCIMVIRLWEVILQFLILGHSVHVYHFVCLPVQSSSFFS